VIFADPTLSALRNTPTAKSLSLKSAEADPSKNWVNGYTHDPLHGEWHSYLEKLKIQNWETDYENGIVFTYSPKSLAQDVPLNRPIAEWHFNSVDELSDWKGVNAQKQSGGAIQIMDLENKMLRATLLNHTAGWKTIKTPMMEVSPDRYYRILLEIQGENTNHVHTKLLEFDNLKKVISTKNLNVVGDGTFGLESNNYDYVSKNKDVKYLQFQVWHDNDVTNPSPSKIWINNIGAYDVTEYTSYESFKIPFAVEKSGDYKILVRYLKSAQGGEIGMELDQNSFNLISKDQLNRFDWEEFSLDLPAGKHYFALKNIEGFNAVNIVAIVPEAEYALQFANISSEMADQNLLYIFDSASHLHYSDATMGPITSKQKGLMHFTSDTRAWEEFEIFSSGDYKLGTVGIGIFNITIDDQSFTISPKDKAVYTSSFRLDSGKHLLEVRAINGSSLESISVFSTETIDALNSSVSQVDPGIDIYSYRKSSPVLWTVDLHASKPFTLVTSEFFDPLWEARVYVGDKLIESKEPVRLYGALNGFVIDSHNEDLRILIQYKPQEGFQIAMIVSGIIFASCFVYMFYEWRKIKGSPRAVMIPEVIAERSGSMSGGANAQEGLNV
jgi:hypothetical protein